MCCLPLLLLQLLFPVVVVVAAGRGEPLQGTLSATSLPHLHLDDEGRPGQRPSDTTSASSSLPGQDLSVLLASGGAGGSNISHYQPGGNSSSSSSSSSLPTAQPLIQKWSRVQQVYPMRPGHRYHLPGTRTDYLRRHNQNFPRSPPQSPLMHGSHARRHSGSTQRQEHTKGGHSSAQTQKHNLGSNLPAQHRENSFDVGYRSPSGILANQFYAPQGIPRYAPRPDPFTRPQQYPRLQSQGRPDTQQKIFRRLPEKQTEEYLKEPGPEISVHDLTSAFYKARELLATSSSVLQTSSTFDTDGAVATLTDSQSSSDTKSNRPAIITPRYDLVRPRAPPESTYYPARHRERPRYTTQRVYDPGRYPPSVSYGEPYFEQHLPPRITHSLLREADHYGPTSHSRSGPHRTQSSLSNNMYNSDTNRRQLSMYNYLAGQNLDEPVYRNQKLNSRKAITRLNYAKLPSGYQSPTTTFEELLNADVGRRKKISSEIKKHQSSDLINGHGRPHLV